ncbi:MAG TPA: hypothetical protein VGB19_01650 [Actinomycetota bacterium]
MNEADRAVVPSRNRWNEPNPESASARRRYRTSNFALPAGGAFHATVNVCTCTVDASGFVTIARGIS